jgi:hypothetical protein
MDGVASDIRAPDAGHSSEPIDAETFARTFSWQRDSGIKTDPERMVGESDRPLPHE